MDSTLYKAARDGNFLHLQLIKDEEAGQEATPQGNTILHIAALYRHSEFVQKVLTITPQLLRHQNKKKETALHIAANEGHTDVVRVLLNCETDREHLIRMTDGVGDTALHKAVRKHHIDVVKLLLIKDPDFQFQPNNAGKTPLYLSAESGFHDALVEILVSCNTPTYLGPSDLTPLHAAIINRHIDCARSLWERNRCLCEEGDTWGWNSLHYAVKLGLKEVVSHMLAWKKSLAYLPAGSETDWTTTFHIAAKEGYVDMMEELLSHCPDCWEMLDSRDQNALHVSILSNQVEATKFLISVPEFYKLIDESDNDGNTPLHLLAASGNYVSELVNHPKAMMMTFSKELSPNEMDLKDQPKQPGEEEKVVKEKNEGRIKETIMATQIHVIVATLVVTITFTAGLTLPGGFESNLGPNQGMAILIRKAAFQAFVVTDAIAFVCSVGAVFSYFAMAANAAFFQRVIADDCLYMLATGLQLFGMASLVIAFITGLYATLVHSVALAIAVCVIGCISFPVYGVMLYFSFDWKVLRPLFGL
ncbi:protein ACCELERATED CELL DEATH 6-like [Lycium barbarum]|uniref:protein ACCELERATED CELL DEATH 6-like n=1 Tax=Lycium barbarum TaxID=112863 RepID=UPI00293F071D|nr:protein ACCELERATED CELL DEATH 6-like [Lycium barbarum]